MTWTITSSALSSAATSIVAGKNKGAHISLDQVRLRLQTTGARAKTSNPTSSFMTNLAKGMKYIFTT
jgi:hypothetical protein